MCSADPSVCMWLVDVPDVHLRREIRDHQKLLAVHAAATLLLLCALLAIWVVSPTGSIDANLCIKYILTVIHCY